MIGVEPLELVRRHITNVPGPLFVAVGLGAEVASVVPTDVEADDLVAGSLYKRNEYRTDIAAVAVYQHSHRDVPPRQLDARQCPTCRPEAEIYSAGSRRMFGSAKLVIGSWPVFGVWPRSVHGCCRRPDRTARTARRPR